jgi:hypothetical protein
MPTNPKSEIRNPKQIQIPKAEMVKTIAGAAISNFEFPSFGFVSDFGFRISDFTASGGSR